MKFSNKICRSYTRPNGGRGESASWSYAGTLASGDTCKVYAVIRCGSLGVKRENGSYVERFVGSWR